MLYPKIEQAIDTPDGGDFYFTITKDLDWLQGHFPDHSILPAVAITSITLHCAQLRFGQDFLTQLHSVVSAKFINPILLHDQVKLHLQYNENTKMLSFVMAQANTTQNYATGKISLY